MKLPVFVDYLNYIDFISVYKDLQTTFELPILDLFINSQVMLCTSGFHIYKVAFLFMDVLSFIMTRLI